MKVTTIIEDGNKRITTIAETEESPNGSRYETSVNDYNSTSSGTMSSLASQIQSVEKDGRQYGDH